MGGAPGMFPMGGANPMFYPAQTNGMGGRGGGFGGYPQVGVALPHNHAMTTQHRSGATECSCSETCVEATLFMQCTCARDGRQFVVPAI